ncbi:MAG: hypothetical protein JRI46_05490 [Deltaproteobacteria bacterium]|nr:hypothetical protein [Deltaproteobacteria bacterium]
MKVAIPLFGTRVSPHFSSSPEVLIAEVKGREILEVKRGLWEGMSSMERMQRLQAWKVEVVICGGIAQTCRSQLRARGIEVIYNQMGEAEEVLRQWVLSSKPKGGAKGVLGPKGDRIGAKVRRRKEDNSHGKIKGAFKGIWH